MELENPSIQKPIHSAEVAGLMHCFYTARGRFKAKFTHDHYSFFSLYQGQNIRSEVSPPSSNIMRWEVPFSNVRSRLRWGSSARS